MNTLLLSMFAAEASALQTKGFDRQTQPPLVWLNLVGNNAESFSQKEAGVPGDLGSMLAATAPMGEPEMDVNIFVRGGAESSQLLSLSEESLNKLKSESRASGLPAVSIAPDADGGSSTTEIVVPSPSRLYHQGASLAELTDGQANKPIPVHIIEQAVANFLERDMTTTGADSGVTVVSGRHTITVASDGPGDNIHVEDQGHTRNVIVSPSAGANLAEVSLEGLEKYAQDQLQLVKKIDQQYKNQIQAQSGAEAPYGCMFARVAAQAAYEAVNRVAHGFGGVISKTCGCAMAGGAASCALKDVPQTCVFPYAAYSGIFSVSQTMWENVKKTTQECRFIQGA